MELAAGKSQLLYHQVRDYLVAHARSGKLGSNGRIPSERDLADNLKISRGTVRMALSELEKSGFIERIPQKGAFLCQPSKKRTTRLALVFPESSMSHDDIADYASWESDSEMWRGMLSACPRVNAVISFLHCPAKKDLKFLENFADNLLAEYDGALFIGYQLSDLRTVLKSKNFPTISLGDVLGESTNFVFYDRTEACELAAKHLLKCGCRNIFLLGVNGDAVSWPLKKAIFRRTFAEAGFWIPDENIIEISRNNEEQCMETLRERLPASNGKLPDAFFCSTQVIPFALLRLANERNWRVPEDFMIMGYANNMQLRPTVPLLTHIRIPYFDIGYKGCEILANNILTGEKLPELTIVKAELVNGKTTYIKQVPVLTETLKYSRNPATSTKERLCSVSN
ncbi:MAG: substrate-binding domain-containing protein [Victivallaceae bacterium]